VTVRREGATWTVGTPVDVGIGRGSVADLGRGDRGMIAPAGDRLLFELSAENR
jgi:hypothetical protein